MIKTTVFAAAFAALAFTAGASAQWTPSHPGDPRTCPSYPQAAHCGSDAAEGAFQAKYQRVTGRRFVGTLQCLEAGNLLTYSCAWKTVTLGAHTTLVRFARKATGWKVAVGVIPTA